MFLICSMMAQCCQLAECSAAFLKRILADVYWQKFIFLCQIFEDFFFSQAAELLARAGRKILERGGNTAWCTHFFIFLLSCWKKISIAFEKVPKNDILLELTIYCSM
jgi:hypothetical protein